MRQLGWGVLPLTVQRLRRSLEAVTYAKVGRYLFKALISRSGSVASTVGRA
jgi:hypothetical protein